MTMNLLIDTLRIIYIFLPMPDKRNFIRVNKKCNTLAYLISKSTKEFWKSIRKMTTHHEFNLENLTILEELIMESLYYGYISIMPRRYINNYNRIFRLRYLYFHAGLIGNKEIIHMITSISNVNYNIILILEGLAYSDNLKLLKMYIYDLITETAGKGILNWFIQKYGTKDGPYSILNSALNNNHTDVFNFLVKKIGSTEADYYREAIKNGYIDMIIRIHDQGYVMRNACKIAAENNQLDILKWLRLKNYPWNEKVCTAAAKNQNNDLLKWLYENKCPWHTYTSYAVAKSGNLEMLKWLEESGCPFGENILSKASRSGNLEMVKYLYEKGFKINRNIYNHVIYSNNLKLIEWINENVSFNYDTNIKSCVIPASYRNYDILKWLVKRNFPCNEIVVENIFHYGDFEMLDWIFENKLVISVYACCEIIKHGRLDVLKTVKKYGCEWKYEVCETAQFIGNINIVRWAHNNGCEWRYCKCYKRKIKNNGICEFTEKSIEKWLKKKYNKEFNFIKLE